MILVQCSTNWTIKPTGIWSDCEFVTYPYMYNRWWRVQVNIWKIIYLNCGERYEDMIDDNINSCQIAALFNSIGNLKFKAQQTNAFVTTGDLKMSGSSFSFWLLSNVPYSNQIVEHSSVKGKWSWEEVLSIWLMVANNAFVCWALNFNVGVLLKGSVKPEKIQVEWDSIPWPLHYQCKALPTELSSRLGAGHFVSTQWWWRVKAK